MRRKELARLLDQATTFSIPHEGITLLEFLNEQARDLQLSRQALQFLHRKGVIWVSERGGHVRIFRQRPIGGRGRPSKAALNAPELIDDRLAKLLNDAHSIFLKMKLLEQRKPAHWKDDMTLFTQLGHSQIAEAENVVRLCRRHIANFGLDLSAIRSALWLDQPTMMKIVVSAAPELAQNSTQNLSALPVKRRQRLPANMSESQRMLRYIQDAGTRGIAAYEIKAKFAGKLTRQDVESLGSMYENVGVIVSVEARASGRGPKALRYFWADLGPVRILSHGVAVAGE